MRKVYLIQNLDCANCAAKIESKIQKIPGVEEAVLTFATGQLRITAENPDALLPAMQAAAESIERDAKIVRREEKAVREASHSHHHEDEDCCCGHDHHHHEDDCCCRHDHHHEGGDCCQPHRDSATKIEPMGKTPSGWARVLRKNRKDLTEVLLGLGLFILGLVLGKADLCLGRVSVSFLLYLLGFLVLGGEVIWTAVRNLFRGQLLDENFLMGLATIGAFAIQEYAEAVGVMLFYRIGELFEEIAVERSRSEIMAAADLRPEVVLLENGEEIPAEEARVGDVLLVRPGDRIPLDGVILAGESRIDTSPITGEPVPVEVQPGSSVVSGCVNLSGQLRLQVERPLSQSMVTRILDSVENAAASKPKIDRFITKFARVYTPVVVGLAAFVALVLPFLLPNWHFFVDPGYAGAIGVLHGSSGTASIFTALTFLVMSCPCALVLSVPLAFFSGIGAGSKRGILFKGGVTLEALSQVKAVVMDKTGTLTKGEFVLQTVEPEGMEENSLLTLCAACEKASTHPIAQSIVAAARERNLPLLEAEEIQEISGHGVKATVEGKAVLCGNRKLMELFKISCPTEKKAYGTEVFAAVDGAYAGSLRISDTIKPEAKAAMAALGRQGIATAMLTGDTEQGAKAVAEELGIDQVYARLLPEEKLLRLREIREKQGAVMFVGDGINDAPVLAGADVGAAMGSGADAAIEAADVVFMTSSAEAIPASVVISCRTRRIAWENVVFALAIKLLVMVLGLLGHASMWMAVFADSGVAMLCVLNSIRLLYKKESSSEK